MAIQIFNTLTGSVEPFETLEPGQVKMYVCGPTVYDKAHIGHAMSALVFDLMRRYLQYRGYRVHHVQNFTDIDDKIINRALAEGRDPIALAEEYIDEWHRHVRELNIVPATAYPRATATIPEIIALIDRLVQQGHAYASGGDVYFRVRTDADYGKLSHRDLEQMRVGARIEPDERKDDPLDFALWKAAKPDEPESVKWDSPWGSGRPGWHIECSAMVFKELGPSIDIHGGGTELIFPHHENEIAQSECATGEPFVRYWVHNGLLQLRAADGTTEKMSKSLGNVVTIDDFLREHPADVMRLMVLASPYRAPLVYDTTVVAENRRKLERMLSALRPPVGNVTEGSAVDALRAAIEQAQAGFEAAMDDDFNGPGATAALFEMVRAINSARDAQIGGQPFADAQAAFRTLADVLGLRLEERTARKDGEAGPFIDLLLQTRTELRKAKQFALADQVRDRLTELGVIVEDTPQGTQWRWK